VFPQETSTSYVEMVPLKPLALKAFTLCMRVATELKGEREVILFAYRTHDYDELNVWRELDGRSASLPVSTYHFLLACTTSCYCVSFPVSTYHFLLACTTSCYHVSFPVSTYHFLLARTTSC